MQRLHDEAEKTRQMAAKHQADLAAKATAKEGAAKQTVVESLAETVAMANEAVSA